MSEVMTNAIIGMPIELAMHSKLSQEQFYLRAQSLLAENATLRNEVQRITEARRIEFNNAEQVRAELESHKRMLLAACAGLGVVGEALGADSEDDASEIEGLAVELRKDAERYRWLREATHFDTPQHQIFCKAYGSALDEEIDVALAGESGQ